MDFDISTGNLKKYVGHVPMAFGTRAYGIDSHKGIYEIFYQRNSVSEAFFFYEVIGTTRMLYYYKGTRQQKSL
jgi:hypothetical protein